MIDIYTNYPTRDKPINVRSSNLQSKTNYQLIVYHTDEKREHKQFLIIRLHQITITYV